jgi:gliding motility-associated-like protein
LKIAVADVTDQALDSGVFLEAGSLTSNAVEIELSSLYTDPNGNSAAVEGCDFNTEFQIHLDAYTLIGDSVVNTGAEDTICFLVTLSGSAVEGVDYLELPDSICFFPGDTLLSISIEAIADGLAEGVDTIVITLTPLDTAVNTCQTTGASSNILIYDELVLDAYPDTAICVGQSVTLHVNAAPNISWSPASSLSCENCLDPVATPTSGGPHVYTVTAGLSPCLATASVTLTVNDPSPVYTSDTVEICLGQTATLVATNATDYTWSPNLHLNTTAGASVEATPPQTTTYTVTGQNACGATSEDVVVLVHSLPVISTSGDASICPEHTAPISASSPGAVSYSWTPEESLSDANAANPTADPEGTTTYYVTVTDQNGCVSVDSVVVGVHEVPDLNAQAFPGVIYPYGYNTQGPPGSDSVALLTVENAASVLWFPTAGLNDPTSTAPLATPSQTTTYYASALSADGCQMADSVVVEVVLFSEVDIPNAFTPNGDGKNDLFRLISRGGFSLSLFAVFDRWGQQVFATTEVAGGRSLGWNGFVDGKPAPVGTYAYVVRGTGADGTPVELQGNVTLLR